MVRALKESSYIPDFVYICRGNLTAGAHGMPRFLTLIKLCVIYSFNITYFVEAKHEKKGLIQAATPGL